MKVSPIQKGVDAMVIEFQHALLGVGEDEETDLDGQVALDLLLEQTLSSNTSLLNSSKS